MHPAEEKPLKKVSAVTARIRDAQGRILLLKRRSDDRSFTGWCLPGGQIDPGETPEAALVREVCEEIGAEVTRIHSLGVEPSPLPGRGRIFLVHTFDVMIDGDIVLSNEHEDHRWVTHEEAIDLDRTDGFSGPVTRKLVLGDELTL